MCVIGLNGWNNFCKFCLCVFFDKLDTRIEFSFRRRFIDVLVSDAFVCIDGGMYFLGFFVLSLFFLFGGLFLLLVKFLYGYFEV